ncbi:TetR/AcrR family transcriptional regulator [Erythrobacter sp.]|uniref:TetR/AcrR family transcriptional regulator n=1 Tax=Erythrobacter sp. TaxID=1042 RepID=UPI0025E90851|nr:TetR/AcrR family transcriptional regulator [Erythrobacter sp.]
MATQKERSDATRARLLEAFRRSILSRGLEATTTQRVLDETGLSKGALYHHFQSKDEIIEALYTRESKVAIERAFDQRAEGKPPLEQLKNGCMAWLDVVKDPDVAAILFKIGPSALGQERAREIENCYGIARLRGLLEEARKQGAIAVDDAQLLASFVNALVAEATLYGLKTGKEVRADLEMAIDAVLDRLTLARPNTVGDEQRMS